METTIIGQVVGLFGTPNTFAGWIILYCIAALLFIVLVVLIFSLPLLLYKR